MDIIKEKTICISGHRYIGKDLKKERVEGFLVKLIEKGFNTFLIGMALGFDTLCFQILERQKEKNNIKIIACIPCPEQPLKFNLRDKNEYYRLLSIADEKVVLSDSYTPYCMQKRNQFMVDNSFAVLCYLNKNSGGTFNTVKYAKKKNVFVIKVI